MVKEKTDINNLVDHLFRHESGRLVSVLTGIFGPDNLVLAEDVVQDSFTEAIKQWSYNGIPDNPTAWIFKVARNKALNVLNREKYKRRYSADVAHSLQYEQPGVQFPDDLFSEQDIRDDQLRMIFTCCHPSISADSQIALTLRTLCGFSIPEIAKAFLSTVETVNKRLVRARQTIQNNRIEFEVPSGNELNNRLDAVLETIYLLFNEGYSASAGDDIIRYELCEEAIHLAGMIVDHPSIQQKSSVYALLSLMFLNASRFGSRQNPRGELVELADQDRDLWNMEMIKKGIAFLDKSVGYGTVSRYQILAAISAHYCSAASDEATDWKSILLLYDNLLQIDDSAVVILNRAVVISKVIGVRQAIEELESLKDKPLLESYPYYYSTLGEFFLMQKKIRKASHQFEKALELTRNRAEREFLQSKINLCRTEN